MTRSAAPPPRQPPAQPPGVPFRAPVELRHRVAGLLAADAKGGADVGQRLLEAGERLGYDMSVLWTCLDESGAPAVACLVAPGAGRLGIAYMGRSPDAQAQAAVPGVIRAACADAADRCGLHVVQALLETDDAGAAHAVEFKRAGFARLADLLFLRRLSRRGDAAGQPPALRGVSLERWRPALDDAFALALERSYEHTHDCPELCDLRDVHDVLASHKAAGRFEPELWWLIRDDAGAPAGVMLLNPTVVGDAAELVYIGLTPALRGRGLGAALLRLGLREAAARGLGSVACAVDSRNEPARALYERLGFVEFARRTPLVRAVRSG